MGKLETIEARTSARHGENLFLPGQSHASFGTTKRQKHRACSPSLYTQYHTLRACATNRVIGSILCARLLAGEYLTQKKGGRENATPLGPSEC